MVHAIRGGRKTCLGVVSQACQVWSLSWRGGMVIKTSRERPISGRAIDDSKLAVVWFSHCSHVIELVGWDGQFLQEAPVSPR